MFFPCALGHRERSAGIGREISTSAMWLRVIRSVGAPLYVFSTEQSLISIVAGVASTPLTHLHLLLSLSGTS